MDLATRIQTMSHAMVVQWDDERFCLQTAFHPENLGLFSERKSLMTPPSSSGATSLVKRFDNVGIAVRDIHTMETFYRDVLGAQILPLEGFLGEGTHLFRMFLGGVTFLVFQTSNPAQHGRTIENILSNAPGYDHLVFEVDDIAAAQTWLESQGIAAGSIQDISIPGLGAFRYLRFKDPEGNSLGLRQPVTKE